MRMVREIQRLYPPERIARSQARLAAVWNLQRPPDSIPFICSGVPVDSDIDGSEAYEAGLPREQFLQLQLEQIIARAPLDDDFIPSLFPGCRQGLIPTAYGAEEELIDHHYWVKPMLEDARQAYELGRPDLSRDGVAGEILENTRYFRHATEGCIPIQMPDMQGPLDLASNMLTTEKLMTDMYDYPEAVHYLLGRMTEDFITYMRLQDEASGHTTVPIHCPPTMWLPHGHAMSLSEDLMAVMSPRLYPDFARRYNERIAAEYGRVVIHTCGSGEHNLTELAKTKGLLAFDFGISETSMERVADQFGSSIVILPHPSGMSIHGLPILKPAEMVDTVFTMVRERDLRVILLVGNEPECSVQDCIEFSREVHARAAWPLN